MKKQFKKGFSETCCALSGASSKNKSAISCLKHKIQSRMLLKN